MSIRRYVVLSIRRRFLTLQPDLVTPPLQTWFFHPSLTLSFLLTLLQLYGKRAAWEDPSKWVNDTYPWSAVSLQQEGQSLLQLRPEDVGYDGYSSSKEGASSKQVSQSDTEGDPLVRRAGQHKNNTKTTRKTSPTHIYNLTIWWISDSLTLVRVKQL